MEVFYTGFRSSSIKTDACKVEHQKLIFFVRGEMQALMLKLFKRTI